MPISINTNVSALNAHASLSSQQRVGMSVQRLSSGLRVNMPADEDASVGAQLRAGAKAISDKAAANLKAESNQARDSVTLQQHAKAEGASAEQSRIDKAQAKSAIKDAAAAEELANFSQHQIRQLVGTSVMAQAGSLSPQAALSLLR